MENSVEIWVEVNGDKRLLDVYEQEVISLNYSLADIQDISKRNTSFSKTISLPDSKSNREAFEFISELNADSLFNQNLKTSCWIYCNSLLIFRGNLQLKKVNTDYVTDTTSLEIVVYNETETFISSMGERYLRDLDLSYFDHIWNYDNVVYSWTQSWEHGYFYPLIDNGSNYSEYNIGTIASYSTIDQNTGVYMNNMTPAVYTKTILDTLFLNNGFNYRSDFLNSDYFKKMIIPHNGKTLVQSDDIYDYNFLVQYLSTPGYYSVGNYSSFNANDNRVNFTDVLEDIYGVYQNSPTYSFVLPNGAPSYVLNFNTDLYINILAATGVSGTIDNLILEPWAQLYDSNVRVKFRRNWNAGVSSNVPIDDADYYYNNAGYSGTLLFSTNWASGTGGPYPEFIYNRSGSIVEFVLIGNSLFASFSCTVNSSDLDNRPDPTLSKYNIPLVDEQIDVILYMDYNTGIKDPLLFPADSSEFYISENSKFYSSIRSKLIPNGIMNVSSILPSKFKQKDFFKGLITMFNLYVEPDDTNNKILNIEPRDDYYQGGLNLDWTDKIDLSSIDFTFISDFQSKNTLLTYKVDSDYPNKQYTGQSDEIYGQQLETFNNDFINDENKIEASFSPTPIVALPGSGGFPISRITKDQNGGTFESNLRIMFRDYIPLEGIKNYWVLWKSFISVGTTPNSYSTIQYSYPWAGHLNHPYRPTYDLNFGQVGVQLSTLNTLSKLYWRNYLDLINDTNSRFLMAKFYLNESDISNLNFKDTIFLNLNGRPMKFLINKISNYNPLIPSLCDVELIKIK